MKKIKLLTGLSTLTVLGLTTLPLTSCNKTAGGVEVTENEWEDAIGYMCGYSDQPMYWRFSQDDYVGMLYESEENSVDEVAWYHDWITTPKGIHSIWTISDAEGKETNGSECYELFAGDCGFQKLIFKDETVQYWNVNNGPYKTMYSFFSTIYSYYKDFTYSNGYYTYSGKIGDLLSLNTKIGFNSNKKMSSLETTCKIDMTEEERGIATLSANVHFDYSQKDIEWPQDMMDRYSRHVFNLSNSKQIDLSICESEEEGMILIIKPEQDGYSKFAAYNQAQITEEIYRVITVLKNGNILQQPSDWDYADDKINFKTSLLKNDVVTINFSPKSSSYQSYTFKLEQ